MAAGGQSDWNALSKDELVAELTALQAKHESLQLSFERALRDKLELAVAVDCLSEGFAIYDADDCLILCNTRYKDMFDKVPDVVQEGVRYETLLHEAAKNGQFPLHGYDIEQWVAFQVEQLQNPEVDVQQQFSDGRWIKANKYKTPDGRVVVIWTEITDLRMREDQLAEQTDLLYMILMNLGEGLAVFNRDLKLTYWNDLFRKLFDFSYMDVGLGVGLLDLLEVADHIEGSERWDDFIQALKDNKAPNTRQQFHLIVGELELEVAYNPMSTSGGYIFTFSDETERFQRQRDLRKAKDEAEVASKAKSDFLATMSHEIRTPMNGILGFSELLLETELDEDQKMFADTVHTSAASLLSIINDILDFSKLESGKMELEQTAFRIMDVLSAVSGLMRLQAEDKGLVFTLDVEDDHPDLVIGDPGRLRQVLLNLCNNAVKFTEKGEIGLHLAVKENDGLDNYVLRLTVSDTGIGIPEEAMPRLFEKFSQVDSSHSRRYGGTGLGLAICKRLVTLMQGEIVVESEANKGTRFHVDIPFSKG